MTATVRHVNDPPVITSIPGTTTTAGESYHYDATASDPDVNEPLLFSLPVAPNGMTIDPPPGEYPGGMGHFPYFFAEFVR